MVASLAAFVLGAAAAAQASPLAAAIRGLRVGRRGGAYWIVLALLLGLLVLSFWRLRRRR